jgi:type IV secretion system protein VirB5
MRKALVAALAAFVMFAGSPARSQIPVTDVLSLVQQVQQVLAWAQQYSQMVETLQHQVDQITQLENTYNSMTGSRGLGALLNGPAQQTSRRYLPADLAQIYDLYSGGIVPGYNALVARINALRGTLSTLPPGYFDAGTDAAAELTRALNALATQRAMAEAAYRTTTDRVPAVESLMGAIAGANDPKAISELQARIAGEQVLAANESNRIQLMLYQQQLERDERERRSLERYSAAQRAPIPTALFPAATF